jgi:hypothetical protein
MNQTQHGMTGRGWPLILVVVGSETQLVTHDTGSVGKLVAAGFSVRSQPGGKIIGVADVVVVAPGPR